MTLPRPLSSALDAWVTQSGAASRSAVVQDAIGDWLDSAARPDALRDFRIWNFWSAAPQGQATHYWGSQPRDRTTVTLSYSLFERMERLVPGGERSRVVQEALMRHLDDLRRARLRREAARLDPEEEHGLAEGVVAAVNETWPEY